MDDIKATGFSEDNNKRLKSPTQGNCSVPSLVNIPAPALSHMVTESSQVKVAASLPTTAGPSMDDSFGSGCMVKITFCMPSMLTERPFTKLFPSAFSILDVKQTLSSEHPLRPDVRDQRFIYLGKPLTNQELLSSILLRHSTAERSKVAELTIHLLLTAGAMERCIGALPKQRTEKDDTDIYHSGASTALFRLLKSKGASIGRVVIYKGKRYILNEKDGVMYLKHVPETQVCTGRAADVPLQGSPEGIPPTEGAAVPEAVQDAPPVQEGPQGDTLSLSVELCFLVFLLSLDGNMMNAFLMSLISIFVLLFRVGILQQVLMAPYNVFRVLFQPFLPPDQPHAGVRPFNRLLSSLFSFIDHFIVPFFVSLIPG